MTGHRSWTAERRARLADPEVARRAVEARASLDRREEDYRRTLGQLRNARRLTQAQLAGAIGVSQAQVSRMAAAEHAGKSQGVLGKSSIWGASQARHGSPWWRYFKTASRPWSLGHPAVECRDAHSK